MTTADEHTPPDGAKDRRRAIAALSADDSNARYRAALAMGSYPEADFIDPLVERVLHEPEFFVREMLTWALARMPRAEVLPRMRNQLADKNPHVRSLALHTLSKINDPQTWAWITPEMLSDPDDEAARTAWRTAVVLVPENEEPALARQLATQFGRGDDVTQLSLSRALLELDDAASPAISTAEKSQNDAVALHARATRALAQHPENGFQLAVEEAKRVVALGVDDAN